MRLSLRSIRPDHEDRGKEARRALSNPAKSTENGDRIALTAWAEGDHFVGRVRDIGEQISADMLTRLFARFTQVGSSARRSRGGLGIGLSPVKDLVEMHGGP